MSFETPGDNVRCDHCDQPGTPYTYEGRAFSGLFPNRGERLCKTCLWRAVENELPHPADVPVRIAWPGPASRIPPS